MGSSNSIRTALSKDDIISSIKLFQSADFTKSNTYIIVEGADDVVFFRNKVSDNTSIQESFSGKLGVYEIVNTFQSDNIIGICDHDYDPIVNNPRIFYYEHACLEMMLINNDEAFSAVVGEYYGGSKPFNILRYDLLQELSWLSCLRKLNSEKRIGINFQGFSIHNSTKDQSLSYQQLILELSKRNPQFVENNRSIFPDCCAMRRELNSLNDYLDITQGHDFICFFHAICVNVKKSKKCSIDSISSCLRCAYPLSAFQNTALYTSILTHSLSTNFDFFK